MNQSIETQSDPTKQKLMYGFGCAFELTKWIVVLVILVTLVHFFVATVAIVDGTSMEPNFHTGEFLVVNRWQYNFGNPARGDNVVLKFPGDPDHKKYIKRIIGMPGERVQIADGKVYINGKKLNEPYLKNTVKTYKLDASTGTPLYNEAIDMIVAPDEYFIIGDNRPNSSDSRIWGTAGKRFLIGKAEIEIWPSVKMVEKIVY